MAIPDDSGVSGRVPNIEQEFTDEGELRPSVAFRILADVHRRFVCYLLVERGGTIPVDELAAHVAGTDPGPGESLQGLPSRAHRRLYHNHLPRLAEHGVVDYDREAEAVSLTDLGEQLEPYLELAREQEREAVEAFLEREG